MGCGLLGGSWLLVDGAVWTSRQTGDVVAFGLALADLSSWCAEAALTLVDVVCCFCAPLLTGGGLLPDLAHLVGCMLSAWGKGMHAAAPSCVI